MVYKESLIAVIKCDGKILREQGEYVNLPFGSEYSILIKNLQTRKAQVKIHIDGKDTGGPFLIDPNSELQLDRFVERMDKGPRFKFIEKTDKISEYRGDKIDDGFIRIEYTYEKQPDVTVTKTVIEEHHHLDWRYYSSRPPSPQPYPGWTVTCDTKNVDDDGIKFENFTSRGMSETGNQGTGNINISESKLIGDSLSDVSCYHSSQPEVAPGITVPGSESHQQFTYGNIGDLEEASHSIIIRLRGVNPQTKDKIEKLVTTKTKLECSSCGKKSKSNVKFCPNCGTSLMY